MILISVTGSFFPPLSNSLRSGRLAPRSCADPAGRYSFGPPIDSGRPFDPLNRTVLKDGFSPGRRRHQERPPAAFQVELERETGRPLDNDISSFHESGVRDPDRGGVDQEKRRVCFDPGRFEKGRVNPRDCDTVAIVDEKCCSVKAAEPEGLRGGAVRGGHQVGEGPAGSRLQGRRFHGLENLDLAFSPGIIPGVPVGFFFRLKIPRGAVRAQNPELPITLADNQGAVLEFGFAARPPTAVHPELAALPRPDIVQENEVLAFFPDDVPQPVGAAEVAARRPRQRRRRKIRRELEDSERRRLLLDAVPGDDETVVIARSVVDVVQVEEPDPVLPGQPDDRVPVLVAVGEG